MAKKGKICRRSDIGEDTNLRNRVLSIVAADAVNATEKDMHLVEAALATNAFIGSGDEIARRRFRDVSRQVPELSEIVWVNPDLADDDAINWLEGGAQTERSRMLGSAV